MLLSKPKYQDALWDGPPASTEPGQHRFPGQHWPKTTYFFLYRINAVVLATGVKYCVSQLLSANCSSVTPRAYYTPPLFYVLHPEPKTKGDLPSRGSHWGRGKKYRAQQMQGSLLCGLSEVGKYARKKKASLEQGQGHKACGGQHS